MQRPGTEGISQSMVSTGCNHGTSIPKHNAVSSAHICGMRCCAGLGQGSREMSDHASAEPFAGERHKQTEHKGELENPPSA